jgi:inner membrane protein
MLAPTHSVFGIFLTLIILAIFGIQLSLHWSIILFAIIGAVLPDIDHPRSMIGKLFPYISIPLERKYGHRTVTHSLFGWIISTLLVSFILVVLVWILSFALNLGLGVWDLLPRWIAAFSISYFSHLVLDMFNKRGSQLFWPDLGRDVIPKNAKFRPESGSKSEIYIFLVLVALLIPALPLSKYGIGSSLRWLLATPGSAIEEFKDQKTHSYLEFKGVLSETKEPIEGTGEIVDVQNQRLVIMYKNNLYTLSDELSADILASHVRVRRTTEPIIIARKTFKDESYDSLLIQIPRTALATGTVHLPDGLELKIPDYIGAYKPIEQKGGDLILKNVTRRQIEQLALSEFFDLQKKKDAAELAKLRVQAEKIQGQIDEFDSGKGLTPLGKELLMSKQDQDKQKTQIAELKSQLDETKVNIEELELKIQKRKFAFSGEVYLRQ